MYGKKQKYKNYDIEKFKKNIININYDFIQ